MTKETILITGAGPNGITGRLLKEKLSSKYNVLSPSSSELDLTDGSAVEHFFQKNDIDYVVHSATYRPITYINRDLKVADELDINLKMFYALAAQCNRFKKMIYFGSGAEFDKRKQIINVSEDDFGRYIPENKYGFGKYIMNLYSRTSHNIYNLRLFGTINAYETPSKNVISNLCAKAIKGLPLQLNRDCRFSFTSIPDLVPIIDYSLTHELKYHDYNVTMGKSYLLSEVAEIINRFSDNKQLISFRQEGLNLEYTATNKRIVNEMNPKFSSIEEAIEKVYRHFWNKRSSINPKDLDCRWIHK